MTVKTKPKALAADAVRDALDALNRSAARGQRIAREHPVPFGSHAIERFRLGNGLTYRPGSSGCLVLVVAAVGVFAALTVLLGHTITHI